MKPGQDPRSGQPKLAPGTGPTWASVFSGCLFSYLYNMGVGGDATLASDFSFSFSVFRSSVMRSWSVTLSLSHLLVNDIGWEEWKLCMYVHGRRGEGKEPYVSSGTVRGHLESLAPVSTSPAGPFVCCCSVQSHSCANNLLLSLQADVVGNAWEVTEVWRYVFGDLQAQDLSDLTWCWHMFYLLSSNQFVLLCAGMQDFLY